MTAINKKLIVVSRAAERRICDLAIMESDINQTRR